MDKKSFFNSIKLKSEDFKLPTGDVVKLFELTAGQREKVFEELEANKVVRAQARIVALSCDSFTEEDIDQLLNLPGELLTNMADVVSRLSGMDGESQKKTNKQS